MKTLRIRTHSALLCGVVALGAWSCTSPTVDAPAVVLRDTYVFACGRWTPASPPATRTLLDVRSWQNSADDAPAPEILNAIRLAGGRVVYQFHGPMVRAELDVAALSKLQDVNFAQTVGDPGAHPVRLLVMLSHDLTPADLQAVEALGGRVTSQWDSLDGYAVVIDDARVPDVRALPGVRSTEFDGVGCFN
jgi:hypothetical protein